MMSLSLAFAMVDAMMLAGKSSTYSSWSIGCVYPVGVYLSPIHPKNDHFSTFSIETATLWGASFMNKPMALTWVDVQGLKLGLKKSSALACTGRGCINLSVSLSSWTVPFNFRAFNPCSPGSALPAKELRIFIRALVHCGQELCTRKLGPQQGAREAFVDQFEGRTSWKTRVVPWGSCIWMFHYFSRWTLCWAHCFNPMLVKHMRTSHLQSSHYHTLASTSSTSGATNTFRNNTFLEEKQLFLEK